MSEVCSFCGLPNDEHPEGMIHIEDGEGGFALVSKKTVGRHAKPANKSYHPK